MFYAFLNSISALAICSRFRVFGLVIGVAITAGSGQVAAKEMLTPLESSNYKVIPDSSRIFAFLENYAAQTRLARVYRFGLSAGGRQLLAVYLSEDAAFLASGRPAAKKMTVLLVAGQHGTEPSGAEALQILLGTIGAGKLRKLLSVMNIVIVPMSNPDGRDLKTRLNGNNVNLSTDFIAITQPETMALVKLLRRLRPHAMLDIHESAILKKKSLGAEGYLTAFEAQFEIANNPNVLHGLRDYALRKFLPVLLKAVNGKGLRASRYVNEITSATQTLTHGGATLRNFRNYAGVRGALSLLLENRLDPPGDYPTPGNIRGRVRKQLLAVTEFLKLLKQNQAPLMAAVAQAKGALSRRPGRGRIALRFAYQPVRKGIRIGIPLTRRDTGQTIVHRFNYAPILKVSLSVPLPSRLFIDSEDRQLEALLQRHGIAFRKLPHPIEVSGEAFRIDNVGFVSRGKGKIGSVLSTKITPIPAKRKVKSGAIVIDLTRPLGFLAPLLLDPRSSNSIYSETSFRDLLKPGSECPILYAQK